MSFPKHTEYKESGADWLGKVPAHWDVPPCRAIVIERSDRNENGDCEDYLSLMANIGVIPYADKGDIGNKKPEDLSKCKMVHEGDFVINSMNYYIGSYGISPYHGVCSPVYIVLTPRNDVVDSRFAFRIFEDNRFQEYAQSFGNGILEHRRSINWDILKTIPVPVPPPDEQKAISSFLDVETSKIDGLVSEQRRLIELLKEKRQAVISHAVTKGLNPNAPMKPSGIPWLGDVPQHWSVSKAKRVAAVFVPQRNKPELNDSGNGVCWVTMEQMQNPEIVDSPLYVSEEAAANAGSKVLKAGAVIASCVGQFEVATINRVDVIINQQLQAYIPGPDINPEYLRLIILLSCSYFEQTGTAATIVYVNQKGFDELPVVVPPIREQQEIVDYLDVQLETFSELQVEAERAIELLQERRTALISAAVTGKIDVRNLANQGANA